MKLKSSHSFEEPQGGMRAKTLTLLNLVDEFGTARGKVGPELSCSWSSQRNSGED
jgi:hypothetical protein